jgi:hypothetical protein
LIERKGRSLRFWHRLLHSPHDGGLLRSAQRCRPPAGCSCAMGFGGRP